MRSDRGQINSNGSVKGSGFEGCTKRDHNGEYRLLVRDLGLHDHEMFFRYFRMLPETFEILLGLVAPAINKKTTKMREPISADQRLLVTL